MCGRSRWYRTCLPRRSTIMWELTIEAREAPPAGFWRDWLEKRAPWEQSPAGIVIYAKRVAKQGFAAFSRRKHPVLGIAPQCAVLWIRGSITLAFMSFFAPTPFM